MQYPIIDLITDAYINNGWTGVDIPNIIEIKYHQSGVGNPSLENIRPIFPGKTVNINGNTINIYDGEVDVLNKKLIVKMGSLFLENLDWSDSTSTRYRSQSIPQMKPCPQTTVLPNLIAEKYTTIRWSDGLATNPDGIAVSNDLNSRLFLYRDNTIPFPSGLIIFELTSYEEYQLNRAELNQFTADYFSHRMKLPLPHYFPHPVIDALQRAAAGTQTADDTEILRHYLTPLGIGGI